MQYKVEVHEELFNKAKEVLSSSQIAGALRMAINEGVTKGRTLVRRAIQDKYNIKTSTLNDDKKGLSIKKASGLNFATAQINANHIPISLSDANPKYRGQAVATRISFKDGKARKGKLIRRSTSQITIEIIKGQRKALSSAFTIGVGTHAQSGQQFGTSAIFARGKKDKTGFKFGKSRYPIDSMSTVSVGTAATNDNTVKIYNEPLSKYAQDRFVHHLERLIKRVDKLSE